MTPFLPSTEGELAYQKVGSKIEVFIALRSAMDDRLVWCRIADEPTVLYVENAMRRKA